jgi:tRNA(fMet)-specific endonuclease VapC
MFASDVTMWLLDTDHVSLILRNELQVKALLAEHIADTAVSIITLQEVFNGWVSKLNEPKDTTERIIWKYHQFWLASEFFKTLPILELDRQAYDRYSQLVAQNPELRKKRIQQDMRIAAIAIANGATIVTRNRRDFELVPGLKIEDWSIGL